MRICQVDAGVAEVIRMGNRLHTLLLTEACLEAVRAYLIAPTPFRPATCFGAHTTIVL